MNDVHNPQDVKEKPIKEDRVKSIESIEEFVDDVHKAYELINSSSVQTREMVEASSILRKHLEKNEP